MRRLGDLLALTSRSQRKTFLLACFPAPPDAPDRDTAVQLTTVRVTPGDTIAVFPPPGSPLFLESVRGMALAEDGGSVHVLDAHTVHHLDMDGNLLGSMGGDGEGPGELKRPWRIQPATGGGAWVLDSGNGVGGSRGPGTRARQAAAVHHPPRRRDDFPFVSTGSRWIPSGRSLTQSSSRTGSSWPRRSRCCSCRSRASRASGVRVTSLLSDRPGRRAHDSPRNAGQAGGELRRLRPALPGQRARDCAGEGRQRRPCPGQCPGH